MINDTCSFINLPAFCFLINKSRQLVYEFFLNNETKTQLKFHYVIKVLKFILQDIYCSKEVANYWKIIASENSIEINRGYFNYLFLSK